PRPPTGPSTITTATSSSVPRAPTSSPLRVICTTSCSASVTRAATTCCCSPAPRTSTSPAVSPSLSKQGGDRDAGEAAGVSRHVGLVRVSDDRGHVGQTPAGARQAQRALETENLVERLRPVTEGG